MAMAKKEPVKATETKTAKVETPKAEAVKKETTKKKPVTETKTTAAKKETAKKAPAKKAEPKTAVIVEYAGRQVQTKDVVAAAKKAFTKANKGVEIKSIEIYVKPEEHVAYYVVNGQGSDDYKVML